MIVVISFFASLNAVNIIILLLLRAVHCKNVVILKDRMIKCIIASPTFKLK
jgi:hypothetical protein